MLIETGIRNFELCNLQTSDIRNNTLRIIGKGKKERYVAITPELAKQMGRYDRIKANYMRDKIAKCDNYFISQSQRPLSIQAIEVIINKIGEQVNLRKEVRCSPHTFRHYFAQTQTRNGLDVFSLSRILGHSNISITHRYLASMGNDEILQKSILTSPIRNL
jgi:integrase/recombinase XerD